MSASHLRFDPVPAARAALNEGASAGHMPLFLLSVLQHFRDVQARRPPTDFRQKAYDNGIVTMTIAIIRTIAIAIVMMTTAVAIYRQ